MNIYRLLKQSSTGTVTQFSEISADEGHVIWQADPSARQAASYMLVELCLELS